MTVIIDGKKIANKLLDNLKEKIKCEKKSPALAVILANNDSASRIYVNSKEKKSALVGIKTCVYNFDKTISQGNLIKLIHELNQDSSINAILLQLPLYKHLDSNELIGLIDPKKDVDGFNPINIGKLSSNCKPYAVPCTPKGILKILNFYKIGIEGKNVVVVGRSNIVGKPLSMLLTNENATVTLAHSKTKDLKKITKQADILIVAAGCPKLIKSDMVKKDAVVIDVGINRLLDKRIVGDVDFDKVKNTASYITPVPGGVGPMTIACLLENTYELFKLQNS